MPTAAARVLTQAIMEQERGEPSAMPAASRPTRAARNGSERGSRANRGLTCANCRSRKTRCDGTQPGCKTCEVYHDQCRYEKPPPMSQIISMAKRLQELEEANHKLRDALSIAARTHETPSYPPTQSSLGMRIGVTGVGDGSVGRSEDSASVHNEETAEDASSPEERLMADLSLDEHGKLCYHGPTSAVYEPAALDARSPDSPIYDEASSKSDARSILTSSALESRAWEGFALGNAGLQIDIPHQTIMRLLQIHWAWISPSFNWVYRPAFMRDMAIEGPYYSPFLLTVMCAHAARFDQAKTSDLLISRARLLLGHEIHRPSSIPTVQALLQLSARDLAFGFISQAWIYSGLAFRMASDLGLHQSTSKMAMIGHLSAEDLEVRTRLFWSCYFWDKAISLYLGRTPVLTDLPFDKAPELHAFAVDDSTEHDLWSPYLGETINLSRMEYGEYPAMEGHFVSSFKNSCKLSVILNDIITHLYSPRRSTSTHSNLKDIRARLDAWRHDSPSYLRCEPPNLPEVCPPPHILSQNLLYYTTIILLHRPFYSNPAHHASCRGASDAIEQLILLFEKTFGFTRITYLMAYCIYTAASVMMQDVKMGDIDANFKMQNFLQALRQGVTTCPVVQRSLDIITGELRPELARAPTARGSQEAAAAVPGNTANNATVPRNYLPAFPYRNQDYDLSMDPNVGTMDLDGFPLLDCFPENHLDSINPPGAQDWFNPQ